MKSQVLFVDDEPLVLNGLRRMLRSLRQEWEMSFATSAREALACLAEKDFAIVVSDMRMPEMDGAALLDAVAERHPGTARLVLSGHADLAAVLRAVRPAHHFLAKPCDPKLLETALQRIRQVALDNRTNMIRRRLGAHRRLPSPSAAITALEAALEETPADLDRISAIVEADIAMSIQVLRLVNAAFFGMPTRTLDPRRAVSILGADIMRSLLREVELFRTVEGSAVDEAAVIELNVGARKLASTAGPTITTQEAGAARNVPAWLSLAGPLAAIETPAPLGEDDKQALGQLLLAYWGFDVSIDDASAVSNAPRRQVAMQGAGSWQPV